ncbi:ferrochelatase [Paludibacterium yongneupense]|uniref:ferrochelatase n=1 Tax=Paludibacterium yongneupense TaxID=400061 RepID=UPI0003F772FB|nr:ferrochelatase [Paludibacterium yongneupense]
MSRYLTEPAFRHDAQSKTGVLLINLGTPEAPTARAVRPYLRQFLSDPRVIEIPRLLWWPLLNGVILPLRPRRSAAKYASIWQAEGSPLLTHTAGMTRQLAERLTRDDDTLLIDFGMRYGKPSVEAAMARMKAAGVERLLVVPLYPQYAASSTASALDAVFRTLVRTRALPDLRVVRHFHDDPGYIAALAANVRAFWQANGRGDVLLLSFHGVPRATLDRGDPYHCECLKTARLLADELELTPDAWRIAFQSRFGRAKWLQPYTSATLAELGRARTSRVDVFCPGFVADCLETLEEIAMEGKETFLTQGGQHFCHIPCLNQNTHWIDAIERIVSAQLAGWHPAKPQDGAPRLARALAHGAVR